MGGVAAADAGGRTWPRLTYTNTAGIQPFRDYDVNRLTENRVRFHPTGGGRTLTLFREGRPAAAPPGEDGIR